MAHEIDEIAVGIGYERVKSLHVFIHEVIEIIGSLRCHAQQRTQQRSHYNKSMPFHRLWLGIRVSLMRSDTLLFFGSDRFADKLLDHLCQIAERCLLLGLAGSFLACFAGSRLVY